ncbi:hypothetical protein NDU88_000285 [Pleurodeles waltl]|uniref:Ig-like domain-containing protein n=1 Tax=Pleurodeles waltl TaxID=8319 RepID=A0AAV7U4Q3_PLEWA|nr:hypothetical protein NDU88_000285 [Pleurodeles waltl]
MPVPGPAGVSVPAVNSVQRVVVPVGVSVPVEVSVQRVAVPVGVSVPEVASVQRVGSARRGIRVRRGGCACSGVWVEGSRACRGVSACSGVWVEGSSACRGVCACSGVCAEGACACGCRGVCACSGLCAEGGSACWGVCACSGVWVEAGSARRGIRVRRGVCACSGVWVEGSSACRGVCACSGVCAEDACACTGAEGRTGPGTVAAGAEGSSVDLVGPWTLKRVQRPGCRLMTTLALCQPCHQVQMDGFAGAPRFLSYPRTFTARSGEDATLRCQIAGDPRPSVVWEKDKCPLPPSGRYRVLEDGTAYQLRISAVTPQDSGQYICKARNGVGETYAAAALHVEGAELAPEPGAHRGPRFLITPVSLKVTRGDHVAFACKVWGQPSPALTWEKDGKPLCHIFESAHFAVGSELEGWHYLKIHSARVPDQGVYVCRARNSCGESLAAAMLLVEPPKDGPPKNSFPLGAERRPRGRHRHWMDAEPEPRILPADGQGPLPGAKAKAFAVSQGKHAKFRCYVTGKPKPEILWRKDGQALRPGRRHLVYEDRQGYFILKVLYCKLRDAGLYVCSASNSAGQTLSAVQLHVRGRVGRA